MTSEYVKEIKKISSYTKIDKTNLHELIQNAKEEFSNNKKNFTIENFNFHELKFYTISHHKNRVIIGYYFLYGNIITFIFFIF